MLEVIVMAGGGPGDELARIEGVSNKAFIKIGEKTLLEYIINAMDQAPSVGKIIVVGPERELSEFKANCGINFKIVPEHGKMLDNLAAGLLEVRQDYLCLVTGSDIPLLTADVMEGFIKLCEPLDHDFYYPVVPREICESRFPDIKRTYVRLREGEFTGGNLVILRPSWFIAERHRLELFVSYRKKPLKLLRLLPFSFLVKYLTRRLSINDLEQYLSHLMNMKARAVPCAFAEIGTDVDKINDLEILRYPGQA